MTLAFGRVVRAESARSADALSTPILGTAAAVHGRVIPRPVVDAHAQAARILADAEALAKRLLEQGRADLEALGIDVVEILDGAVHNAQIDARAACQLAENGNTIFGQRRLNDRDSDRWLINRRG